MQRKRGVNGRFQKKVSEVPSLKKNEVAAPGGNIEKMALETVSSESSALLSPKDACDILDACARNKVAAIQFCNLTVTFVAPGETEKSPDSVVGGEPTADDVARARQRKAALKVEQEEAAQLEEIEAEDFELEQLKVINPAEYERRVLNQEVEG